MINWTITSEDNLPENGKRITIHNPYTLTCSQIKEMIVPNMGFSSGEREYFLTNITHWSYDLVNRPEAIGFFVFNSTILQILEHLEATNKWRTNDPK